MFINKRFLILQGNVGLYISINNSIKYYYLYT
jgi:hypothetical protein